MHMRVTNLFFHCTLIVVFSNMSVLEVWIHWITSISKSVEVCTWDFCKTLFSMMQLATVGELIEDNIPLTHVISTAGGSKARVTSVVHITTIRDHRYARKSPNTTITNRPHNSCQALSKTRSLLPHPTERKILCLTASCAFDKKPFAPTIPAIAFKLFWFVCTMCRRSAWAGH